MLTSLTMHVTRLYLAARPRRSARPTEAGFEIAQSMGIALLGLVVAAVFATALRGLGADIIEAIRSQLNL